MPTDASSESPDERWASQKERLMVVKSSHGIAVSVKQAFSEKMHRKLASTAPPRPSIALSFDDAITQAVAICDELIEATRVVQYEYYHSIESLIVSRLSQDRPICDGNTDNKLADFPFRIRRKGPAAVSIQPWRLAIFGVERQQSCWLWSHRSPITW